MLFEGMIQEETGKKIPESDTLVTESGKDKLPVNILDRERNKLIADQKSDLTLEKVRKESSKMAPESDGYFFPNDLWMHRKYLPEERNGTRYVD